ncbi:MAG: response regulator [Candidatus Omnitrophica bacterium]|nr:response regulator [Candidatus Omnitrophota bacterium]
MNLSVKQEGGKVNTDSKKVYIVDDDESVCRSLKCLLSTFGFTVETFLSGGEFFAAVTDTDPGCLVLDVNMPGLDGWEVQKRLALSGSKRQFIIITADKDNSLRERAAEIGAVGFLQKPFNDQQLVNLINQSFEIGDNSMRNNFLMFFIAAFLMTTALGCNMFKGAGKDMENAGQSIQKTADR